MLRTYLIIMRVRILPLWRAYNIIRSYIRLKLYLIMNVMLQSFNVACYSLLIHALLHRSYSLSESLEIKKSILKISFREVLLAKLLLHSFPTMNLALSFFFFLKVTTLPPNKKMLTFWHDRQCMQIPLQILFPTAIELSLNKDTLVNSLWGRARWQLNLSQPLSVLEKTQIRNLKSLLREITPSQVMEYQPSRDRVKMENFR